MHEQRTERRVAAPVRGKQRIEQTLAALGQQPLQQPVVEFGGRTPEQRFGAPGNRAAAAQQPVALGVQRVVEIEQHDGGRRWRGHQRHTSSAATNTSWL
ncbi:MAG: hypothetical protein JSR94_15925 [Proteobacteria bacterium]|nr:hypothetical protein [Pseudomonadota bacterium]